MRTTIFLSLLSSVLFGLSGCTSPTDATPPGVGLPGSDYNLAIILVDTLRPDHLGCYGYTRARTPVIDSLASKGLLFENAYSASTFTGEAVAALFTGRPPVMSTSGLGWTARPMPQEESLPKLLEASGFKTGIFSTSFVMRFRGFYDSFQEAELFPSIENSTALDDSLTDAALEFATRHQGVRTFQYLHYYAPHAPYNPPTAYLEALETDPRILEPSDDVHPMDLATQGMSPDDPRLAELKKHYDGEIAFIDQAIGRYLEGLTELGLLSKTIVVLVSDHGEEFMEHGFADHAWNLYEESLRIPLVIHAPALIGPQRVSEKVSIYDVMPTVLRLLHQPHRPYVSPVSGQYLVTPGESSWNYVPRTGPIYASLFPETRAQLHAVLFDQYKYIAGPRWLDAGACKQFWLLQGVMAEDAKSGDFHPLDPWGPTEREALFDLQTDPGEGINLLESHTETVARGRALLKEYREASAPYRAKSAPTTMVTPFNEEYVREQLKRLSEGLVTPGDGHGHGETRIDPAVIESLETMGYL